MTFYWPNESSINAEDIHLSRRHKKDILKHKELIILEEL